ncbi:MAG: hypothetical protein KBI44_17170 [Thermoanaerobaculia bacterium]|nr:hypothetical protein [Thermoanaerobaculia bacterium]
MTKALLRSDGEQFHCGALEEALPPALAEEDSAHAPFAQKPAESPGAEGPAGGGRRGQFRGSVDERLDPGALLAVEQRMGALARREQVGELAGESAIVRAPLANEGGARPIVRQLSRFVEESP